MFSQTFRIPGKIVIPANSNLQISLMLIYSLAFIKQQLCVKILRAILCLNWLFLQSHKYRYSYFIDKYAESKKLNNLAKYSLLDSL